MITVYISIGNSDDKLSQLDWAAFHNRVNIEIRRLAFIVHGHWLSEASSPWQNACWCMELEDRETSHLKQILTHVADLYGQESIAWAEAKTEFLSP